MNYRETIDPATIPADVLYSEIGRRRNAMRKTYGAGTGRPRVMRKCPTCKAQFSAREMQTHTPRCPGRKAAAK